MIDAGEEMPGTVADFAMDPHLAVWPLPEAGREAARKRMVEFALVHDGRHVRGVSAYTPGADDLRVLLAVLAVPGEPADASDASHIRLATTLDDVCRSAGVRRGEDGYEQVIDALLRLCHIHAHDLGPAAAPPRRMTTLPGLNLFEECKVDDGLVTVVVNTRLATLLLGPRLALPGMSGPLT